MVYGTISNFIQDDVVSYGLGMAYVCTAGLSVNPYALSVLACPSKTTDKHTDPKILMHYMALALWIYSEAIQSRTILILGIIFAIVIIIQKITGQIPLILFIVECWLLVGLIYRHHCDAPII